ncbi:ABC transporter permease [bacterium]|nr:ABC transporter permease [candidate division CSSED10-310 bacterium]
MAIGKTSYLHDLKVVFSNRDLIFSLAVKDFKVRYRSATLGFLWMLLNPVLQMLVLSLVFSFIVRIPVDVPYPIFLLCGLLPWNFMSMTLGIGASSLVNERNLVKKLYFPREIIPISVAAGHFINFLIALLLFLPVPLFFLKTWSWALLFLPIPILLLALFTISITSLATLSDAFFRDTRFIVEALLMVWFYATPIFYPYSYLTSLTGVIPRWIMPFVNMIRFNPMAGIISMFRNILLKGEPPRLADGLYVLIITTALLLFSFILYRRHGPIIADHM